MGPMVQQMQSACDRCGGQGKSFRTKKQREVLEVHVQMGASDGHKITCREKADEHPDAEPGDVHFVIQEQSHSDFKRKGCDLFVERKISLVEALCGFELEVTHLDGRKLTVRTRSGEIIKTVSYDPCAKGNQDCPWEVHNETVAKADISDPEKCKEAAQGQLKRKGIDVVCFVEQNGSTEFMSGSRVHSVTQAPEGQHHVCCSGRQRFLCSANDEGGAG
mmetsp:Transcript_49722/g.108579  ORF Transcript_49722/g.108579 Transcript_49722/m.108579 type:complete len:219 (-) Transcript_49722:518-1174(-)